MGVFLKELHGCHPPTGGGLSGQSYSPDPLGCVQAGCGSQRNPRPEGSAVPRSQVVGTSIELELQCYPEPALALLAFHLSNVSKQRRVVAALAHCQRLSMT